MVESGEFKAALTALSTLRQPLDTFFDATTVNDPDPALRLNRLRLLAQVKHAMDIVADFSQIEG
jgi:glycyl-tRNA synthetase beta chain